MRRKKVKYIISGVVLILALGSGLFLVLQKKANFETNPVDIKNEAQINGESETESSGPLSPISGIPCENGERRPFAVMLSGDAITRPLSGIGQADLVFEMTVVENSITRLMAVYVCSSPSQIGSVRSARQDFIPLADGLDAIYAHWGGSHFALDKLKTGIIDNMDALPNPYNIFYRQSGIEAPHNGFTSMTRLSNGAQKLGYRTSSEFTGYLHLSDQEIFSHGKESKILTIDYAGPYKVAYHYDPETNSYWRWRGNEKEIDKNTKTQVSAKNVLIMRALSHVLEGQYNEVQVEGQGQAEYYLNGQASNGTWKKNAKDPKSKLTFYDVKGNEIKFVPGSIWVEIVDPGLVVKYE